MSDKLPVYINDPLSGSWRVRDKEHLGSYTDRGAARSANLKDIGAKARAIGEAFKKSSEERQKNMKEHQHPYWNKK